MNDPTDRHSRYFAEMHRADESLDDALAAVRAEHDAGRITLLQACAERCELLERHLAECQRLRGELDRS